MYNVHVPVHVNNSLLMHKVLFFLKHRVPNIWKYVGMHSELPVHELVEVCAINTDCTCQYNACYAQWMFMCPCKWTYIYMYMYSTVHIPYHTCMYIATETVTLALHVGLLFSSTPYFCGMVPCPGNQSLVMIWWLSYHLVRSVIASPASQAHAQSCYRPREAS